jgi:hypothetical protein
MVGLELDDHCAVAVVSYPDVIEVPLLGAEFERREDLYNERVFNSC